MLEIATTNFNALDDTRGSSCTIARWANAQFRADTARLEADIAALRAAGLPMS
jgi:hypothetical protein